MIETHDQHKQGNLANSAVLKMLEEEESERVYPGYKKVAWPPASDCIPIKASTPQPQHPSQQGGHYYQPQQQTHPNYSQQKSVNSPQSQQQYYQQQYQSYHQQKSVPSGTYYNQEHQSYPQQGSYPSNQQQISHPQQKTYPHQYQQQHHQNQSPHYQQHQQHFYPQQQQSPHPQHQQQQSPYPQHQQQHQQQQNPHPQHQQQQSPYPQHQQHQESPYPQHQQPSYTNPAPIVSFCGGIPVRDTRSSSRPPQPALSLHQPPPQHASQPLSPSSQTPLSPINQPGKGWSHVRGPTPTRIGYTQTPHYQSVNTPESPYGSGYEPQFGAGHQVSCAFYRVKFGAKFKNFSQINTINHLNNHIIRL